MTNKTTYWVIFQDGRITDTKPHRCPHMAFKTHLTGEDRAILEHLLERMIHAVAPVEYNVHFLDALKLVYRHGSPDTRTIIAKSVIHVRSATQAHSEGSVTS